MNVDRLFSALQDEEHSTLMALLRSAYDYLSVDDRNSVFGDYVVQLSPTPVEGDKLLADIERFLTMSRSGYYYEPFDIDSKNFMDVLEETDEWFDKIGDFLHDSSQLVAQGDYPKAVAYFGLLYDSITEVDEGEEIVFGDEIGTWMIPGDEKEYLAADINAAVNITTADEFANIVVPLAQRDSYQSLSGQVYATACSMASDTQREKLDAEVQRLKIRTEQWW